MALADTLKRLGFIEDERGRAAAETNAETAGVNDNGTYTVQAVYVRDNIVVTVEQNQAPEQLGDGMTAVVTHPPLAVIASPKGRVAFNPADTELAGSLVEQLA